MWQSNSFHFIFQPNVNTGWFVLGLLLPNKIKKWVEKFETKHEWSSCPFLWWVSSSETSRNKTKVSETKSDQHINPNLIFHTLLPRHLFYPKQLASFSLSHYTLHTPYAARPPSQPWGNQSEDKPEQGPISTTATKHRKRTMQETLI